MALLVVECDTAILGSLYNTLRVAEQICSTCIQMLGEEYEESGDRVCLRVRVAQRDVERVREHLSESCQRRVIVTIESNSC
jgi:hypothetical protein